MDLDLELTLEAADFFGTMYFADKAGRQYVCSLNGFNEIAAEQGERCIEIPSALAEKGRSFATPRHAWKYASAVGAFDMLYTTIYLGTIKKYDEKSLSRIAELQEQTRAFLAKNNGILETIPAFERMRTYLEKSPQEIYRFHK